MSTTKQQLLTLREVVDQLPIQITQEAVRWWVSHGVGGRKLPARRIGKRWFVDPEDLDDFLSATGAA